MKIEEQLKIGTHDSVTGEKPHWLSWIATPFAKTQTKTIYEQWRAGCTMFDIRVKYAFGKWRGAHGCWYTKCSIEDILKTLNVLAAPDCPIHVALTYEGNINSAEKFTQKVKEWKRAYTRITWGQIAAKYSKKWTFKVEYAVIEQPDKGSKGGVQAFLPLDGKHWQTFIPIPWLWKQFYFKHVDFNTIEYKIVDFL